MDSLWKVYQIFIVSRANFYLIIIANIYNFPKIGGDSSTENKLHLIFFTKNIIKKDIKKLKPVLYLRYLGEDILRGEQGKYLYSLKLL